MDSELAMASSECSSGCQSGWTTYLDVDVDDHTSSCGDKARLPYYSDYSSDDLSMISDASSGPPHINCNAERRRGRREQTDTTAAARRQSNRAAAAAASLLEDTASSPACFFAYSKAMGSGEANNGYGAADAQMAEIANTNAADFSYAFSTTTGFKSPFNGAALRSDYMQMHYSPPAAPVKPMPRTQVCRDASKKKRW